ncbi:DUF5009 domain-containing protein, partial [Bacteroides fragilis]
MKKPSSTPSPRLASLDILRGFDLFLLVFFQPVLWTLAHQLNLPWLNSILFQFDHEVWEGFRFWDLVMPLFLFMTGASMPFSFSKFKGKYSINSLVYWVTYVHNVVYSFYRSMIYCYINSTQRCAGSIV